MAWHPYDLDRLAQDIVLKARQRDPESLNQAHRMRASCAYGLERFWGEHLRLARKDNDGDKGKADNDKVAFVGDVWRALVGVLDMAGITLPAQVMDANRSEADILDVAERLWGLEKHDQQAALAVLTNLCDAVVWWTQRLKSGSGRDR